MGKNDAMNNLPCIYESVVGRLGVWSMDEVIIRIAFISSEQDYRKPATRMEKQVVHQLRSYFENARFRFSGLKLQPARTHLQGMLRHLLQTTKAGEVFTYKTVARWLGTSARAVGSICSANPYPVLVPCHRVVAVNGLGGYTGFSDSHSNLRIKQHLIAHESVVGSDISLLGGAE